MKFRKKPIVIEAFQWTGGPDQEEDPVWIINKIRDGEVNFANGAMQIKTLEGVMTANVGDFIIQGVSGEIYPCKPGIFEKTYEQV